MWQSGDNAFEIRGLRRVMSQGDGPSRMNIWLPMELKGT